MSPTAIALDMSGAGPALESIDERGAATTPHCRQVGLAGVDLALAAVLAALGPLLLVCVCGGWRLSCAERESGVVVGSTPGSNAYASTRRKPRPANQRSASSSSFLSAADPKRRLPRLQIPRKHAFAPDWLRAPLSSSRDRLVPKRENDVGEPSGEPTGGEYLREWLPDQELERARGSQDGAQAVGIQGTSPRVPRSSSYVDGVGENAQGVKDEATKARDRQESSLFVNPMFSTRSTPSESSSTAPTVAHYAGDAEDTIARPAFARTVSHSGSERIVHGIDTGAFGATASAFERFLAATSPNLRAHPSTSAWGSRRNSVVFGLDGVGAGDGSSDAGRGILEGASVAPHPSAAGKLDGGPARRPAVIPVTLAHRSHSHSLSVDAGFDFNRARSGAVAKTKVSSSGVYDGVENGLLGLGTDSTHSAPTFRSGKKGYLDDSANLDERPSRSRLLERVLASQLSSAGVELGRGRSWTAGSNGIWRATDSWSFTSTSESSGDPRAGRTGRFRRKNRGHMRGQSSGSSSASAGGISSRTSSYGSVSMSSRSSSLVAPPPFPRLGHHSSLSSLSFGARGARAAEAIEAGRRHSSVSDENGGVAVSEFIDAATLEYESNHPDGHQRGRGEQWNQVGWPRSASSAPAMPSWWLCYVGAGIGDKASAPSTAKAAGGRKAPDERVAAGGAEAHGKRLGRVFGAQGGDDRRRFVQFVRSRRPGMSSFDSRAGRGTVGPSGTAGRSRFGRGGGGDDEDHGGRGEGGHEGEEEEEEGGNNEGGEVPRGGEARGGKSAPRGVTPRWMGDTTVLRAATPLSSAELKREFEFDFEDECEGEGDRAEPVRVSARFSRIRARRGLSCEQPKMLPEAPVDAE